MDQLYATTLLISLAFGSVALALALLGRAQPARAVGCIRWSSPLALGAWVALCVSIAAHLGWEHTPGGPQAIPPLEFVVAHRSFVVAALIAGVALMARPRVERSR
jgi:hypothetical protein